MEDILCLAGNYKYNSMEYVDQEDITEGKIFLKTSENLFLYQKATSRKELYWEDKSDNNIQLFWATQSKDDFIDGLYEFIAYLKQHDSVFEKIFIEFVPEEFLEAIGEIGFIVTSEWVDFWNRDLSTVNLDLKQIGKIREMNKDEIPEVSNITLSCAGLSRGFTGEAVETINEWYESDNSKLFVHEADGEIVGMCFVKLYGFDSEGGTVLWIRELAVDANHQANGIGRELLNYVINWGINNGAKRSFLACDAENVHAIKLYESLHYSRKDERGQINMELQIMDK